MGSFEDFPTAQLSIHWLPTTKRWLVQGWSLDGDGSLARCATGYAETTAAVDQDTVRVLVLQAAAELQARLF